MLISKALIIDTETGGLDPRMNPLLSINLLAFERDPAYKILDNFHLKIMPPPGTLLEIPMDPQDTSHQPPIAHLIDADGNSYECNEKGLPKDEALHRRPVIAFGAARVNGFTWEGWKGQAVPREQADQSFRGFIDAWFATKPVAYAHNASFDDKFVLYTFPDTYQAIQRPWLCTMTLYKAYLKQTKEKASAKLAELAKRANTDPTTPAYLTLKGGDEDVISKAHDAGADCKMCFGAIKWLATKMGDTAVFPMVGAAMPDERHDE